MRIRDEVTLVCKTCGTGFYRPPSHREKASYCSRKCRAEAQSKWQIQDLSERFWAKVDKTDSCWVWTGALLKTGYGSIRVNHKSERAHRISYVLTHGSIPEGAILRHSCDNPRCVNPDHLISGTKRENTLDAIERGQHVTGERHKNAKLTAADVVTIRYALATGTTGRELAAKYKVDAKTISNIKLNKKWISR